MFHKRRKDLDYYYYYYFHGFSGEQELFAEYLNDLRTRHNLIGVSVFCDYGSHGVEIVETTIYAAEDFCKLKQNVHSMNVAFSDFLDGNRKSVCTSFGSSAKMRSGVRDMQIYHFRFKDGLFDCYVVCEGSAIFRKELFSPDTICLLRAFLYQKQLKDFHKIGYSYDGYMGIPSRDELLNRLYLLTDVSGKTTYLMGIRIVNRDELEKNFYKLSDVVSDLIGYFSSFYKGDMYALGNDRIVLLRSAGEALDCVDRLEAHISELSQKFPWISVSANVTPVVCEPLEVLYEVEKGLLKCATDTIVVSRRCSEISAVYEESEQYRGCMVDEQTIEDDIPGDEMEEIGFEL